MEWGYWTPLLPYEAWVVNNRRYNTREYRPLWNMSGVLSTWDGLHFPLSSTLCPDQISQAGISVARYDSRLQTRFHSPRYPFTFQICTLRPLASWPTPGSQYLYSTIPWLHPQTFGHFHKRLLQIWPFLRTVFSRRLLQLIALHDRVDFHSSTLSVGIRVKGFRHFPPFEW